MIKPHVIQTVPKEEQNTILAANNEPNHERQLFEEEIPYIYFLLSMSHMISYGLMFVSLQKRQGDHPTLGM